MTRKSASLSAGVVVVRCTAGTYHYLLLRAYRYWDFPKGGVEANEPALAAARREVKEESGLAPLDFRWGDSFYETEPYGNNKIARYYVAESTDGDVVLAVNSALGKPEHHEYVWADYQTAQRLVGPRVRAALEWAHAIVGEDC